MSVQFLVLNSRNFDCAAECLKLWLLDAWSACTHKKKVLASVIMAFWNLSSIKTRIFTSKSLVRELLVRIDQNEPL